MSLRVAFWHRSSRARVSDASLIFALTGAIAFAPRADAQLTAKVTVQATAGLDEPTRQLLNHLPENIREQTNLLLADLQKRADLSVSSYLREINRIIDEQIDKASCALIGSAETLKNMFSLEQVVWGKKPQQIGALKERWSDLSTDFSTTTPPDGFRIGYADFLVNSYATACAVRNEPSGHIEVAQIQSTARKSWDIWVRVGACPNPRACLALRLQKTNELLNSADPRDIKTVDAWNRFRAVSLPEEPGFLATLSHFRQAPYESALRKLFAIEDEVHVAAYLRKEQEQRAHPHLYSARAVANGADAAIAALRAAIAPDADLETIRVALLRCRAAAGNGPQIAQALVDLAKDSAFAGEGPALKSRWDAFLRDAPALLELVYKNKARLLILGTQARPLGGEFVECPLPR